MRVFRPMAVSFPLALALTGCGEISAPGPLQVTVAARPDAIAPGDTTQIVVTVRNVSAGRVWVNPPACNLGFELVSTHDGATPVTLPSGMCPAVYGPVSVEPGESLERTVAWDGFYYDCTGSSCARAPVAPGSYKLIGGIRYGPDAIRSAPIAFTVE
jgi:hypothetical protein